MDHAGHSVPVNEDRQTQGLDLEVAHLLLCQDFGPSLSIGKGMLHPMGAMGGDGSFRT